MKHFEKVFKIITLYTQNKSNIGFEQALIQNFDFGWRGG